MIFKCVNATALSKRSSGKASCTTWQHMLNQWCEFVGGAPKGAFCAFLFTFAVSSLLRRSRTLLTLIGCFSLSYTPCHL